MNFESIGLVSNVLNIYEVQLLEDHNDDFKLYVTYLTIILRRFKSGYDFSVR